MGHIADNGDGSFDYDPQSQFEHLAVGEQAFEVFAYTISDGTVTDTATVTITVEGANDRSVAHNDDYVVGYEGTLTVPAAEGVLYNDQDTDGDVLTADLDEEPSGMLSLASDDDWGWQYVTDEDTAFTTGNVLDNDTDNGEGGALVIADVDTSGIAGLLTQNDDGTFFYDPNDQFEFLAVGEQRFETFTYTISDAGGLTDTAIVTITVNGLNDPPIASDDAGEDYTTDQHTPFTTGNVLNNDTDLDGPDALSVVSVDTDGTLGQVTDNGDGTFDYDPAGQFASLDAGEQAVDTFTYAAGDGLKSDTVTVTITITGGLNSPPTISDIPNQVVPVNDVLGPIPFTVQDQETPADELTLSAASSNAALVPGDAILLGGAGVSRTVTITPTADQLGDAVITITVSGGEDAAGDAFELWVVEHTLYLPLVVRNTSVPGG